MTRRSGGSFASRGRTGDGTLPSGYPLPAPRHRLRGRPKWITIAASPFLLGAFFQSPTGMITDLAAFGIIAGAMVLTREGLLAQATYESLPAARRPAFPRKLFGGLLAGLGLGLGAAEPGAWGGAGLIAVAGAALHYLSFGADPLRDKGMEGADGFQQARAGRLIDEAEDHLARMADAIGRAGDRGLSDRVAQFDATVRSLFDQLRQNPADLATLRRYLGVYLVSARDTTAKFADLYARTHDPEARAAYQAFLDDLERDFTARRRQLLEGGRADLEIEMSVLRDRLAREGVRPAAGAAPGAAAGAAEGARAVRGAPALQSQAALNLDEILRRPERDRTR